MIISLLYDDRYAEAGGITSLVCACSFARHLCVINDCAFLAIGKSRTFGLVMFASAITQLATTLIGVTYWGLGGVVLATGIGPCGRVSFDYFADTAFRDLVYEVGRFDGFIERSNVLVWFLASW
jgi:O-antigen/teichoic acid export membrane protein